MTNLEKAAIAIHCELTGMEDTREFAARPIGHRKMNAITSSFAKSLTRFSLCADAARNFNFMLRVRPARNFTYS